MSKISPQILKIDWPLMFIQLRTLDAVHSKNKGPNVIEDIVDGQDTTDRMTCRSLNSLTNCKSY